MKVEPYIGEERPDPAAVAESRYPVEFTASAAEYFRIWIVNLALTIATLGIYSAWAKVRKKRYFYAHTKIDGDGFEYRGRPLAPCKVSWQNETRLRFAIKNLQGGQLRHMCAQVGLQVVSSRRLRVGRVPLSKMPVGQWRYLPVTERF